MKKNKKYLRLLLLSLFTVVTLLTCKPSLGGQVDIYHPEGAITYPDTGETPIRGSFVIKGTAKDDEEVADVSVVFTNKETKAKLRPFKGSLTPAGNGNVDWQINVDNKSTGTEKDHPLVKIYPIPDGEYEAKIIITDKQGKPTVLNTTYKIDNTPPVFIVERPSLSADHNAANPAGDGYGAVMKIKGSAADTHELRSVTLKVNDGLSITKKNKENSVDIIMAIDGDSDYRNLLTAAGGHDKPLKAVITLQDNARTYGGGTPGDTGNESAFYYVKNEIEGLLDLNTYTAKVISDYFSGKKGKSDGTPHERAVYALRNTDENARNVLSSKRIIPDTTKSVFSLNPAKSPGFKVTGISPFIDQPLPPLMQFSSTTSLTVELYPNRDRNALVAGTDYKTRGIKVVLCKGETVEKLKNGEYESKKALFDAAAEGADLSGVEQSGGLIKITKLLPADTKPGLYRIIAEGTDVKNNSGFVPYGAGNKPSEGCFIVKLEATGAPYIFFHALNRYQKANFGISCDVKNLSGGKVDYKLNADPTGSPASSGPSLLTSDSSGTVYTGTVLLPSEVPEGSHTVHVRAYNSDVLFNTAQVPFIFDKTPPSPAGLTDPVQTANHTFSTWSHIFKGTVADQIPAGLQLSDISNIDKVTYRIGTKANSSAPIVYKPNESPATLIDPASPAAPYTWEAPVSFGQKTDNYLRVSIYDKAGNKTDTDFGPYAVNTDSPQVKFEDVRFSLGTSYSEASPLTLVKQNAVIGNGVSENNKKASFKIFAYSAFEIESVKVSVGDGEKTGTKTGMSTDGYEEWTVNDVPLAEGNPNFKLYVKSKSGTLTEWQTPVIADFTAPTVKQSSPDLHGIFFKEIQLMGTITDEVPSGSGIASGADKDTVTYKIGNSDFVTVHNPGGVEWSKLTYSGGAWTINISDIAKYTAAYGATVPSGGGVHSIPVQIRVSDKAGNERTSDPFTIKFDPEGGAPFADLTAPKQGDRLGGDILISGSAHVANPASGKTVKEIYLQMGQTLANLESNTEWQLGGRNYGYRDGVKIYPASGSADVYYWNYTLPDAVRRDILGTASSKEVFLRVRAKNGDDVFSEWTEPVSFTINTDVAKFSDIKLQKGSEAAAPYSPNSVWLKGNDFKITGAVSHSAGIQNTIKAESPAVLPTGYEKLDTSDTSGWFTQANIGSDKGYTFKIPIKTSHYAKKAGNIQFDIWAIDARTDGTPIQVSYPITLKYDNSKPAVTAGVHKVKSDTAVFTGGQFASNLEPAKKDLYRVLVNNKVYKVQSITGTNVVLSGASSLTGSFDYGIVEQPQMIYNDGSAYQIMGIASDTGSGVQKVTVKLEVVQGGVPQSVSVDMTADHASNKISKERGDMVSFKGSLNTEAVPNGKGTLTVTAFDENENQMSETITDVIVKNSPVGISEINLQTDLSGNNAYESGENIAISAFGNEDANRDFRGKKDVKSDFTFKNAAKSEIAISLAGGKGTIRTVKLYKDSVSAANLVMEKTETSNTITLNLANETNPGQTAGSPLVKIGDAPDKKLIIQVFDDDRGEGADWYAQAEINVGVDAVDDVAPKGFIMPFFYNSDESRITKIDDLPLVSAVYDVEKTSEGVITKVKEPLGHIELAAVSALGNSHPSVSGKVKLRGIAYDNIRLKELKLSGAGIDATATFTSGQWSGNLKVVKNGLSNTGHYVEWEYEWNTGAPALDQTVKLTVKDAADPDLTSGAGETDGNAGTGTRNGDRGMTLGGTHKAVKHQFIRLYEDEKSYLVQVDTVSADGKKVTWKDTSVPTGITTYRLYDENSNKTTLGVNVVPYITKVTTKLSGGSSLHPSTVNRSALGVYPVSRFKTNSGWKNESITVEGFNIAPGANNIFTVSDKAISVKSDGTGFETDTVQIPNSNVSVVNGKYTVNLQPITKSGYLSYAAKVGTKYIPAINNINTNTKEYNKEPNKRNNNILNDDRYIKLLDVYTVQGLGDMRQLDFAVYENTLNFSAGYIDKYFSVFQSVAGINATAQNLRDSYTRYFDNCIAYNDDGTAFTLSACGDTLGSTASNGFGGGPSKFGLVKAPVAGQSASSQNEYQATNNMTLSLESNYNGSELNNLNRFQWPDMTVKGNNTATKGYISYYDSTQKLVKFRYFESASTVTPGYTKNPGFDGTTLFPSGGATPHIEQAVPKYTKDSKKYHQGFVAIAGADANSPYSAVGVTSDGTAVVVWYDAVVGALKLKYNTDPANSFSGYQAFDTPLNQGTISFKIKVDGAAVPKEVSVTANQSISTRFPYEFAYQLNKVLSENGYGAYAEYDPILKKVVVRSMQTGTASSIAITELKSGDTSSGSVATAVPGTGEKWIEKVIDTDQAGKNPSLTVDSKNGLHIAYNATGSGDLRYAYIPKVTESNVFVSTVDSYQQTGAYTDIAVKEVTEGDNTYIVPYISYFTMSLADTRYSVKLAVLKDRLIPKMGNHSFTNDAHGAVDELFTGKWEVMHIPSGEIPVQYRVNVEVAQNGSVYLAYQGDKIEYVKVE